MQVWRNRAKVEGAKSSANFDMRFGKFDVISMFFERTKTEVLLYSLFQESIDFFIHGAEVARLLLSSPGLEHPAYID